MDRSPRLKQGSFKRCRFPCFRCVLRSLCTLCCGSLTFIIVVGCSKDDGRIDVYPTSGKVLVNGQAAHGARVVYYPKVAEADGLRMPTPAATTDSAGVYHLESYDSQDGAPAGEYIVTVVWPEPPPPNAEALGVYEQKDRLQERFADPAKSGLTATVPEGGGELPPLELE
jgi:hypothetical protein